MAKKQQGPISALGVHLVEGDLTAPLPILTALFAGVDVLVSCTSHERYGVDQMRVVEAAKAAGVKRYLPTAYGVDAEGVGPGSPLAPAPEVRTTVFAAIAETGLPFTVVDCGLWSEWLLTHLLGIDYVRQVITAVGSFDRRVSTTTVKDCGELVCELLLDDSTRGMRHVHVASDTLTMEELALLPTHHPHTRSPTHLRAEYNDCTHY